VCTEKGCADPESARGGGLCSYHREASRQRIRDLGLDPDERGDFGALVSKLVKAKKAKKAKDNDREGGEEE
jgi:hypothetical protein